MMKTTGGDTWEMTLEWPDTRRPNDDPRLKLYVMPRDRVARAGERRLATLLELTPGELEDFVYAATYWRDRVRAGFQSMAVRPPFELPSQMEHRRAIHEVMHEAAARDQDAHDDENQ